MHFGFEPYIAFVEYVSYIVVIFLTIFWRPVIGIFFLLPMIPMETIRYRINDLPLGHSLFVVTLLSVVLGLIRLGKPILPKTPWTSLLCIYGVFTFVSLCLGSLYLGRSLPIPDSARFGIWHDYMAMPALLFLTAAVEPTRGQMKAMVIVMCVAMLAVDHSFWGAISGRDFSTFSSDLRDAGSIGDAGSNGLAAFEAQTTTFLLAIASFERKMLLRLGYLGIAVFSAICAMYSFSRGGYLALLVGVLFLGLVRQRTFLVLLVLFFWVGTSLVPQAVQQRVLMTYDQNNGSLDHSAVTRFTLWEDAMQVVSGNPVIGTGFATYAYMHRVGDYKDTHNLFLKVLLETGVVGLLLFLWLLASTFGTSYQLFRHAEDPFVASLGLGLAGWVVCAIVANAFGDRWTFLQVNGYMWVLGGLVARGWALQPSETPAMASEVVGDTGSLLGAATEEA
jgi:putative inorganic carbon (HCO3(-)) transporter